MNPSITVAIVTRNRAKDLQECLTSLSRQSLRPKRILVINNASTDTTSEVISAFSKQLPIRNIYEKTTGYPHVYNRALREVKTPWVAFIDDDCVADGQWFFEVTRAVQKYSSRAAIIGASKNYYPTNIWACTFQFWYDYWRGRSVSGDRVLDYRTLDSRNVVLNRETLNNYHIKFDPSFFRGAEDSDVGLQLQHMRLSAAYAQQVVIYHKEPISLTTFFRKKKQYSYASLRLAVKWVRLKSPRISLLERLLLLRRVFLQTADELAMSHQLIVPVVIIIDYAFSKFKLYEFNMGNALILMGKDHS